MKEFSRSWKVSKQVRKQRKYRYNAPLHLRKKFMSALLSKDLRKKHHTRNIPIRKGDKVKILRGKEKKKIGVVSKVNLKYNFINIEGIQNTKKSGMKVPVKLQPSNVMITELNLEDKERKKILERRIKK